MPEQCSGRPSSYSVDDWVRSMEGLSISAYMEPALIQGHSFTKDDFQQALKKVSRKRETFFGENIKDALKAIKD